MKSKDEPRKYHKTAWRAHVRLVGFRHESGVWNQGKSTTSTSSGIARQVLVKQASHSGKDPSYSHALLVLRTPYTTPQAGLVLESRVSRRCRAYLCLRWLGFVLTALTRFPNGRLCVWTWRCGKEGKRERGKERKNERMKE